MKNFVTKSNPLQGTASSRDFSRGNTLPLVARPWGMHHWTLQTGPSPWTFNSGHTKLQGVRLTHQPSPWMGDYGSLLITAFHGPTTASASHQASAFRLGDTTIQPNYLRASLLRYQIDIEFAPTERGGIFAFQRCSSNPIRIRLLFEGDHDVWNCDDASAFAGASRNNSGGVPPNFALHFCGQFNIEPSQFEAVDNGAIFTFSSNVDAVELRIAASFVNSETAVLSLRRELEGRTLEEIAGEGAVVWNDLLGRPEIEFRDEEREQTFYSCLYRCLLFPRFLDEIDQHGSVVHYSPYDGLIHSGSLCADNGFWDTHRTVYSLLSHLYPEKLTSIMTGWLSACKEAGWTPKWPSPGPRNCMIGTHFDAVVAECVAKGVVDWDIEKAFEYLMRDATEESGQPCFGREGLFDYIRLGYVPSDKHRYSVSATLDHCYNDFCVAQVAQYLGKLDKANSLRSRSLAYKNIFDPAIGFMRGRKTNGDWDTFREFGWGGAYIEGGPWQHSFHVPHDPHGLAMLFGGKRQLCRKLDNLFTLPPIYDAREYIYEIHEMTEMASVNFGQYAHSNQPVHGYLFLYTLMGEKDKTDFLVHRVASELYSSQHLPGDEDNGEMSAWYVFACLGIYPYCPGRKEFVNFTPFAQSGGIADFSRKWGSEQTTRLHKTQRKPSILSI